MGDQRRMASFPLEAVGKHSSEESAWVANNGRVFDVTDFVSRHPGGRDILLKSSGKDVTETMNDPNIHKHSSVAYSLLNKYSIGKLISKNEVYKEEEDLNMDGYKENELVDWNKPMVAQVGKLGAEYMKWVHSPVDRPLRLFEPEFIEFFSKTPWYMVPIVWLPVVLYVSIIGLTNLHHDNFLLFHGSTVLVNIYVIFLVFVCVFLFGTFVWTFAEYILHRYLFHITPPDDSPFWITFHFFLHGQHHKVPFDSSRLVFPPVAAAVFAISFYLFFVTTLPYGFANSLFAGGLLGYVMYDCIHYYLHHGSPANGGYFHKLKSYHVAHHFDDPHRGYGISSQLWDFPFKTSPLKLN